MKMIVPKPINLSRVQQMVDVALTATMDVVRVDFGLTTKSWESESKPQWNLVRPQTVGRNREMSYVTESTPFIWVDWGTKGPYPIPKIPKTTGFLAFQAGFTPKTQPRVISSGPGARFGPFVFAKQVMHPGIKPREFSLEISDRATASLARNMFVVLGRI